MRIWIDAPSDAKAGVPRVWPGSYGIVILVEGAAAARPAPEQCVPGILVENAPVEQSAVRIVGE